MMRLTEYFTALTATALIGVVLSGIIKDTGIRNVIQIVMGVLLLLVLLKPIANINLDQLGNQIQELFQQEFQTPDYEHLYQDKLRRQVKDTTELYISQKAESLGASVSVEITLNDTGYPFPVAVRISGLLTQTQRDALQDYITREIDIPVEEQRWEIYE